MRHLLFLLCTAFVLAACGPAGVEQAARLWAAVQLRTAPAASAPAAAPIAYVNGKSIGSAEFEKRLRYERAGLQAQLKQLQQLEQQFGGQGFFATQIDQLQTMLADPFALGSYALDNMIADLLVADEAQARGIAVSSKEVEQALRQEVADARGLMTEPQATATAAAANAADAATPSPLQPSPAAIIDETTLAQGFEEMEQFLAAAADLSLDEYREIVRSRLLRDKLTAAIGAETVAVVEEQVHARHILLLVDASLPASATPEPSAAPDNAASRGPYADTEALALAQSLREHILAGEDFGALAQAYSDDPGSAVNGGDLGWFGRGMMVLPFEEATFMLPVGTVSEPVRTDFGYHLIEVLERDDARPKDQAILAQEKAQAFDAWLNEQLASSAVRRTGNLLDYMPEGNSSIDAVLATVLEPDVPAEWFQGAMLGSPDARLVVHIWSDFLCPACQQFALTVERNLIERYVQSGEVKIAYHYFPLQQHEPGATTVALAAACAANQNRFWPFHWLVMMATRDQGQDAAAFDTLEAQAAGAGMDQEAFETCLARQQELGVITGSTEEAHRLGLQFVPSVIVGDVLLQDSSFATVEGEIERQLR